MKALIAIAATLGLSGIGCFPTYIFDITAADQTAGYAYRSELHFERAHVAAPLTNVPVLIHLSESDGSILYAPMRQDGQDLRFFAADQVTELPYEVERWDNTGTSLVWVRVPQLDASTSIWMYFGNKTAITAQDPVTVWSEYAATYHFEDDLTSNVIRDSAQGHNAVSSYADDTQNICSSNKAFTSANQVEAQIGKGLALDGTSAAQIDLGDDAASFSPEAGGGRTLELWMQRHDANSTGQPLSSESCCMGWDLDMIGQTPSGPEWIMQSRFGYTTCCGATAKPANISALSLPNGQMDVSWHYVVMTMDRSAGRMEINIDGVPDPSSGVAMDTSAVLVPSPSACIGSGIGANPQLIFEGNIDEVRVGKRAFSTDWIATQHQSMTEQLVTFPVAPTAVQ